MWGRENVWGRRERKHVGTGAIRHPRFFASGAPPMMTGSVVPRHAPRLIYLKLLLMAFFWGGTFIAGRFLAGRITPFPAAFLRFTMASMVLVLLTLHKHRGWPRILPGQWLPLLLLGLSGVFAYNAFFFKGLELITAGRAAVIVANNPVLIAVFASLLLGEKLGLLRIDRKSVV